MVRARCANLAGQPRPTVSIIDSPAGVYPERPSRPSYDNKRNGACGLRAHGSLVGPICPGAPNNTPIVVTNYGGYAEMDCFETVQRTPGSNIYQIGSERRAAVYIAAFEMLNVAISSPDICRKRPLRVYYYCFLRIIIPSFDNAFRVFNYQMKERVKMNDCTRNDRK